jgi:hypothetical protein
MTCLPSQCVVRKRVEKAMRAAPGKDRADPHRWLGGLKMLTTFAGEPLEVRFREIGDSQRALLETLGVTVIIDPGAPPPYSFGDYDKNIRIKRDYQGRR